MGFSFTFQAHHHQLSYTVQGGARRGGLGCAHRTTPALVIATGQQSHSALKSLQARLCLNFFDCSFFVEGTVSRSHIMERVAETAELLGVEASIGTSKLEIGHATKDFIAGTNSLLPSDRGCVSPAEPAFAYARLSQFPLKQHVQLCSHRTAMSKALLLMILLHELSYALFVTQVRSVAWLESVQASPWIPSGCACSSEAPSKPLQQQSCEPAVQRLACGTCSGA